MLKYCLVISLLLSGAVSVAAADGVKCRLALYQYDSAAQANVILYEDTCTFVRNLPATGFIGPFSLEIELKQIDSESVAFDAHVVALGPPTGNFSRSFTMEYPLPARMEGIESKNGSRYSLTIAPLSRVDVNDACVIDYRDSKSFTSMPSAYMDIYFMPSSHGDYNWESIRNYLDYEYRQYQAFANFTLPGKVMVYLCPCAAYSVIWDRRFGTAVDPTRNNAFAIVDKSLNTADPFIVTYISLLRNYGYSPPFLAEGLANFFLFSTHDAREIVRNDPAFSLEPFLATYEYHTADPFVADRTSSSFVRFLVARYSLSRFFELYRQADDLNIRKKMEAIYELPFDSLQTQWRQWLDTVSINAREYAAAAGLAEQLFNYKLMAQNADGFLANASSKPDSMEALRLVRKAYFSLGDYYTADSMQTLIIRIDTTNALSWMTRGSYRMMNGDYDKALADFQKAAAMDTASQTIRFNLALCYLYRGQTGQAKDLLWKNVSTQKGASAQGETRIYLAHILNNSGDSAQVETAKHYLQEAVAMYQQSLSVNRSVASNYLWLGIALTELNEATLALEYLQVAEFLEMRPFYSGMIDLWLGKAYDRLGQPEKAREYLSRVLAASSADYHQREARTYLEQP